MVVQRDLWISLPNIKHSKENQVMDKVPHMESVD